MLETLGGIAGFIVLLGSALVYFRGAFNKARIDALREDNQDLRLRNTDLEMEIKVLKTSTETLQSKIETLESLVTQRVQVEEVIELLTEHHSESLEAWATISRGIASMKR